MSRMCKCAVSGKARNLDIMIMSEFLITNFIYFFSHHQEGQKLMISMVLLFQLQLEIPRDAGGRLIIIIISLLSATLAVHCTSIKRLSESEGWLPYCSNSQGTMVSQIK